ncbi:MAG TPA: hypothetical protein PKV67_06100 [Hyphomonas sp.]|nr:hypothetical protein [Hyphomonas sp.]
MRSILVAATAVALLPMTAEASGTSFFADAAVSTALIDRGEHLALDVLEATIGAEADVRGVTVYGAVYRILPFGNAQGEFDDEADYTLGVAWEGAGYSADLSANWLTYPGAGSEASLELAATVALDAAFAPTLAGFYDADLQDWGLEVSAGPEWEVGDWTLYTLGRAGFVQLGDGSPSRSYGGVEIGAARALSELATLGLYARGEVADEDSFVRKTSGGTVTEMSNSGFSAGIVLSIAH